MHVPGPNEKINTNDWSCVENNWACSTFARLIGWFVETFIGNEPSYTAFGYVVWHSIPFILIGLFWLAINFMR